MDLEREVVRNGLWTAITNIDLQLYKGGVYKLRWGSPGVGLDMGIPCYREAARTALEWPWPEALRRAAEELAEQVDKYVVTLEGQDVTSASSQQTRMMASFEALREQVRAWPDAGPGAGGPGG